MSDLPTHPLLYTIEQAAAILSLSRRQVERLMQSGELDWVRLGKHRRISHSTLTSFVIRLHVERVAGDLEAPCERCDVLLVLHLLGQGFDHALYRGQVVGALFCPKNGADA